MAGHLALRTARWPHDLACAASAPPRKSAGVARALVEKHSRLEDLLNVARTGAPAHLVLVDVLTRTLLAKRAPARVRNPAQVVLCRR